MANTIYLKDFIDKFNDIEDDEKRNEYVASFIKRNYVSYGEKVDSCHRIINSSYYVNGEDQTVFLHINSPAAFMLFCLEIVSQYTSIIVDYSNAVDSYDILRKSSIIDMIFSFIPKYELKEYDMVLDMVKGDVIQNEYEPHAYLRNLVDRFARVSGVTLVGIQKFLEDNIEKLKE